MLEIVLTKTFIKDLNRVKFNINTQKRYLEAIFLISNKKDLPNYFKKHELKGELENFLEIHLSGDLLLIYSIENEKLQLLRIGSHSQIFKKF